MVWEFGFKCFFISEYLLNGFWFCYVVDGNGVCDVVIWWIFDVSYEFLCCWFGYSDGDGWVCCWIL